MRKIKAYLFLKVILLWGVLLTVVTYLGLFFLSSLTNASDQALAFPGGLIITFIPVLFAGFAGYKTAQSLANVPEYQKRWNLILLGATPVFISAGFNSGIHYFLTGQFSFNMELIPFMMAVLGAYLFARKQKF